MKRNMNKISAILVTLIMIASVMVVLRLTTPTVSASYTNFTTTPGVDKFERGNYTVGNDVLNTSVADLEYDYNGYIDANGEATWGSQTYYLWYPVYSGGVSGTDYSLSWKKYPGAGLDEAPSITPSSGDLRFGSTDEVIPTLNHSGLWLIGPDGMSPDAHNLSEMNSTIPAWFWVNTSTIYTVTEPEDFDYAGSGEISIIVEEEGEETDSMVAIVQDSTGKCIWTKNQLYETGDPVTAGEDADNFTGAGTYNVYAYMDLDGAGTEAGDQDLYRYTYADYYKYYFGNGTYGNETTFSSQATTYNYDLCGPWDPPECNATIRSFEVKTAKPNIEMTNTSTVYWGLKKRIDVNVTQSDGIGIAGGTIKLRKSGETRYYVDAELDHVWINDTLKGNYSIEFPRVKSGVDNYDWNTLGNDSWYVYFIKDVDTDGTEDWNSTATSANKFKVTGTNPPVQLVITDDGQGTLRTDNKINIPAYTATSGTTPTIDIKFTIYGTSIADEHGTAYYGDDTGEDWKNITVSGDILYPMTETTLAWVTDGDWVATVTPTKPGGTITIKIDWPGDDNGTDSETIDIINGTNVVSDIESFSIGDETTLTFTVTDMDGNPVTRALVYLMWEGLSDEFNDTAGDNTAGNGKDGVYSRLLTVDDQGTSAPKNVTIAIKDKSSEFWGYAKVKMDKNHDMNVTITPITSFAGDPTEYDIAVGLIDGGHPDETDLKIMIYDENGDPVTSDDIVSGTWPIEDDYDITESEIILAGGIYYLYAYNDSHDSQGHNASITITKYTVTSSPSVLAWLIDTDTDVTFQVAPAGNGTLTLNNVSNTPEAAVDDTETVNIENGIGTLEGVNATSLGNVTFEYTPEGGDSRDTNGLLRVTTATATPDPATIYIDESITVTVTVTHPATGAPLKDVRVGLDHGKALNETILSKLPDDEITDAEGIVQFSIKAETSGDVTIYIKNETDPDNEFVITAEARNTMKITTSVPAVNEGDSFTVEAKSGDALITDATVTITFAGDIITTTTGTKTLTAPTVSTSLDYTITATADGYSDATATIKVLNKPILTIIPQSGDVFGTETFTVTVADDAGQAIIGAKVTFNGADYYTGTGGSVSIKAPDVKEKDGKLYTLTATFTGFTDAASVDKLIKQTKSGIPGFELITLIAAIGVALILLRRRRN